MTKPARALTMHRTLVPMGERGKFIERLKARAAYYTSAGVRYWVFEEQAIPGAFVEFAEADSPAALSAAHAKAPEPMLDPNRIYTQVELA